MESSYASLFVLGLIVLALNIRVMKGTFKSDEEREEEARDTWATLKTFAGETRAFMVFLTLAVIIYSCYIGFYLCGFIVFEGVPVLEYLPWFMIALTVYNFGSNYYMLKKDSVKINFGDKIGTSATIIYVLLYLYYCWGKVGI